MQLFCGTDYRRLKETLDWRIDKWSREKCVSFIVMLGVRHASAGKKGYHGRLPANQVDLFPDGSVYLWRLCELENFRILEVTPEEIIRIIKSFQREEHSKQRIELLDLEGTPRCRAGQGQSGRAMDQIDRDELYDLIEPGHKDWVDTGLHGTTSTTLTIRPGFAVAPTRS